MKEWKKLAALLGLVAILVAVNVLRPSGGPPGRATAESTSPTAKGRSRPEAPIPDARLQLERLESSNRVAAGDIERNVFEYGKVQAAPHRAQRVQVEQPAPPPPPPEPRPSLRFFGLAEGGTAGRSRALLTQGEDIFVATEGDVVLRRYRVVRIQSSSVEVEDITRNRRWVLPLEQP
jgi:hypothetical protein